MSFKSSVAIAAGRASYWFLHNFLHGGTALPGKITLALDPEVLQTLSRNYEVVIITGTNGKTLTTALTVKVLRTNYDNVLTNPSGSNMKQGIVTAFLTAQRTKSGRYLAILETDEANVALITRYVKPSAFVLTNIFRDQMDRYGEIYTTYAKILDGIRMAPQATIIANGDAPIFNSKKLPNPTIYYGFNATEDREQMAAPNTDGLLCPNCQSILHYYQLTYSNLGKYYCPNCDFKRPALTHQVTAVNAQTPTTSTFEIDGQPVKLHIGGTYNIYNALAAYSVGRHFDIDTNLIMQALNSEDEKVFGRQEVINIQDKEVTLILVKNPVGLDQVLSMLKTDNDPFSLAVLLNANYADGIDTSWIWDGRFENLPFERIPSVLAGGERYRDIAFRLKVAGVPAQNFEERENLNTVLEAIKKMPTKHVYVLATYTAVLQLRKAMAAQGYIKEGME
ncbi:Mur ligase family protein [Liquorilactobacillus capillatus]|uniref:Lipid II isoglutaminyl synthase (glutamine-hydrolyzing) subunit MurT n=1 Tax=Liquorilactobacillus capillatus DSM 19910 TaxID=1423731 RepID=A0A0R1LWY5_9LACO|nr:Mur ligase family protein [Liquorilactobacillus capillatus]KRL00143.1 UDP-N-acetylmuramoylalanyl-D-glutamate--2,6-diaminopimelate ligase [Liquorilactobacillus capillatus DSM 19910]